MTRSQRGIARRCLIPRRWSRCCGVRPAERRQCQDEWGGPSADRARRGVADGDRAPGGPTRRCRIPPCSPTSGGASGPNSWRGRSSRRTTGSTCTGCWSTCKAWRWGAGIRWNPPTATSPRLTGLLEFLVRPPLDGTEHSAPCAGSCSPCAVPAVVPPCCGSPIALSRRGAARNGSRSLWTGGTEARCRWPLGPAGGHGEHRRVSETTTASLDERGDAGPGPGQRRRHAGHRGLRRAAAARGVRRHPLPDPARPDADHPAPGPRPAAPGRGAGEPGRQRPVPAGPAQCPERP